MNIGWSALGIADREAIFDHIAHDNPHVAVAVDGRIQSQVARLALFPEVGRLGRVAGTRELIVGGTPYIVAYALTGQTIRILRVLHGAQLWPISLD